MAEYGIKQTFPDKVTDFSVAAQNGLGTLRFEGDKVYRYVQANATLTARHAVSYIVNAVAGTNGFKVTNASANVNTTAGVAVSAITANYYGWIQVGGPASCIGDGSVAFGEVCVNNGDGTVDTMAATEEAAMVGVALEDDVATTYYVQVMLKGLF